MIRALILLLVTTIAILFGGTPDWARGVGMAGIGLITLTSGYAIWRTDHPALSPAEKMAGLLFALVAGWSFVTILPGSASWIGGGATGQVAQTLNIVGPSTISVAPDTTREALLWFVGLGAWAYCVHLAARRHLSFARTALWSVAAIVVAFAFYGLVLRMLGLELVLWHEKQAYVGAMTGPFINKNHFATLLGIGLVCVTALMFEIRDRAPRQARMRDHGVGSSVAGIRFERIAALIMAFGVLITALILTQSRAGVGASLFGLFVVLLCGLMAGRRRALPIIVAAGLAGFAVLIAFFVQDDGLRQRLEMTEGALQGRLALYESVADISLENPLTGTGLGTFEQVFRMKKPDGIHHYFDVAHNTYLELGFELGWPATLAILALFLLLGTALLSALIRHSNRPAPYLAAIGASAVVGSHALFDFSLQIPAITLIYLMLFAAALGHDRAR